MKYAHYIGLRIFSYENDDEELVRQKLIELVPYEKEEDRIKLESKKQIVTDDKIIRVISCDIKKSSQINRFLKQLMIRLPDGEKRLLLDQLESRLDDTLHFYIRLKKEEFLKDKFELTDGGNCLHIKIAIAAYPHKREVAKELVEKIIKI